MKKHPEHIAIIMDGNGRWAKQRHLPREAGHRQGAVAAKEIIRASMDLGIRVLTLYAFSTENWQRPRIEIKALFRLLKLFIKDNLSDLISGNIKLRCIGDLASFPPDLQNIVNTAVTKTAGNTGMQLNIALNYGGRQELIRAVNKIIVSGIKPPVSEKIFEDYLDTAGIPDPDLLIRTSGENRISNFLLWQLAYTEFYITEVLWPNFDRAELVKAIEIYSKRDRRFGGL